MILSTGAPLRNWETRKHEHGGVFSSNSLEDRRRLSLPLRHHEQRFSLTTEGENHMRRPAGPHRHSKVSLPSLDAGPGFPHHLVSPIRAGARTWTLDGSPEGTRATGDHSDHQGKTMLVPMESWQRQASLAVNREMRRASVTTSPTSTGVSVVGGGTGRAGNRYRYSLTSAQPATVRSHRLAAFSNPPAVLVTSPSVDVPSPSRERRRPRLQSAFSTISERDDDQSPPPTSPTEDVEGGSADVAENISDAQSGGVTIEERRRSQQEEERGSEHGRDQLTVVPEGGVSGTTGTADRNNPFGLATTVLFSGGGGDGVVDERSNKAKPWPCRPCGLLLSVAHTFLGVVLIIYDVVTNHISGTPFAISAGICFILCGLLAWIASRRLDRGTIGVLLCFSIVSLCLALAIGGQSFSRINLLCHDHWEEGGCESTEASVLIALLCLSAVEATVCVVSMLVAVRSLRKSYDMVNSATLYSWLIGGIQPNNRLAASGVHSPEVTHKPPIPLVP